MSTHPLIRHLGRIALLALIAWLPALSSPAADQPTQKAASSNSVNKEEEHGVAASGTARDTLEACLARIPEDASAGQRMMAEQSCARDEEARESIQAVPGS